MQVLFRTHAQRAEALLGRSAGAWKVAVRLVNYPDSSMQIRLLKANSIGKDTTLSQSLWHFPRACDGEQLCRHR